jgi:hypothetical protein
MIALRAFWSSILFLQHHHNVVYNKSTMDWKAHFLKTYANLPQAAREEIIAVVNQEPYSWQAAKLEVEHDTPIGKEILALLVKLKILQ